MKNITLLISCIVVSVFCHGQKKVTTTTTKATKPKLVVGIVVDQMRWDYLYRFADRYGAAGFRRLLDDGFTCENTFIPYTPTVTAAGHTCVYTGSVPAIHGIMGNDWFSREHNRNMYCAEDSTASTVGSSSNAGKMSPANMWTTTVTDELRVASNFRSKVIGIALKDRGAILPAGHTANAAYWFDNANGAFISSTYYMKELPAWVQQFNSKKWPDQYLSKNWNTLYPINTYAQSTADEKPYESDFPGGRTTFPHLTSEITKDKYNAFRSTPYANTYTADMAKAAVEGEQLGQSGNTDFLAVSFSTPDQIGHAFGPNSIEIEDNYLRLDRDLADFFTYLDGKLGKGQYTVFITADHAVSHVPGFNTENKVPAGLLSSSVLRTGINNLIESRFNIKNGVKAMANYQVYLDTTVLQSPESEKIKEAVIQHLLTYPAISNAFVMSQVSTVALPAMIKGMVTNGYNQKLSGDIQYMYKPQYFSGSSKGTTHSSWNPYDSHIPLVWYGWGIKKGKTNRQTYMTDIAPTVSALLHIQMPSGTIGTVIEEVIQ